MYNVLLYIYIFLDSNVQSPGPLNDGSTTFYSEHNYVSQSLFTPSVYVSKKSQHRNRIIGMI